MDQAVSKFLDTYDLNIDDLVAMDPTQLTSLQSQFQPIVRYHFGDQVVDSEIINLLDIIRLDSHFSGKQVVLRSTEDDTPFELIDGQGNKCNVLIPDLKACEGVVHMVGCMLLPDL
eukprot:TRINITY_DN2448_c0_g1_i10.p8 TRINITY_DN2448_c0_g1~~TRINITY_DN2448_c0_g1_i10.p8  ORF type:complete len:116 (-),score=13.72 TRINITY_DN2448_c0_g1_i10:1467-1814(-)